MEARKKKKDNFPALVSNKIAADNQELFSFQHDELHFNIITTMLQKKDEGLSLFEVGFSLLVKMDNGVAQNLSILFKRMFYCKL